MRLTALPAFEDNYIWAMVADSGDAFFVDPGQAAPVMDFVERHQLRPRALLLTHHHADHIGGVPALRARWPALEVIAPGDERIGEASQRVADGDRVQLAGDDFRVIAVPGHTLSHVAYVGDGKLFSGDTLFSLGCGRMFEGTAPQMLASLRQLAALPEDLQVCCGHEYTSSNAAFARHVDPANAVLQRRQQEVLAMRHADRPTLPVSLSTELACNPFLRTADTAIRAAAEAHAGQSLVDETEVFAELRRWKDVFRA